ncbi:MAG: DUF1616 domain-containing protein [Candidatus Kerfeldbacteria bacterium]|nr:DUF1616 domain-containing protein [Candidatus Kerfeldbacteria bacterium]
MSLQTDLNSIFAITYLTIGIVYGLFLYGFSWTWAMYPQTNELPWLDRCIISFGISLTLQPLIIYLLHVTILLAPSLEGVWFIDLTTTVITIIVYAVRRQSLHHRS